VESPDEFLTLRTVERIALGYGDPQLGFDSGVRAPVHSWRLARDIAGVAGWQGFQSALQRAYPVRVPIDVILPCRGVCQVMTGTAPEQIASAE
jgi:hypothetical protein